MFFGWQPQRYGHLDWQENVNEISKEKNYEMIPDNYSKKMNRKKTILDRTIVESLHTHNAFWINTSNTS